MTQGEISAFPVLIAGGGIGGLAAALALSTRGIPSFVLEAAVEFGEVGAGLQISPNGSRILRSLGVGEPLAKQAGRPERLCIHDGISGRLLTALPLGDHVTRRYGAPYYVAERRVLHRLLLETVRARQDVALITGFRLSAFEQQDGSVEASAEDGRAVRGRALIGTDGVRSRVRTALFGVEAGFSGRIAWRATAPLSSCITNDGDVHLWLGPRAHLVHYRCGPSGPFNAVAVVEAQDQTARQSSSLPRGLLSRRAARPSPARGEGNQAAPPPAQVSDRTAPRVGTIPCRGRAECVSIPGEGALHQALDRQESPDRSTVELSRAVYERSFAQWASQPKEILAGFDSWTPWPLMALPPLTRWSIGRTTLLGDAAHPLLPFLASGAVAAIEDAAVLAAQLAGRPDNPERAFQAYEAARIPRLDRIVRGSQRMGEIYHMQGPVRLARNLVLGAMPPALLLARNDWLYGYCAAD
jgi:2-polyprenyl-6-methoxyphenol hydroxylase-like FAD-dependent oxidoreductase